MLDISARISIRMNVSGRSGLLFSVWEGRGRRGDKNTVILFESFYSRMGLTGGTVKLSVKNILNSVVVRVKLRRKIHYLRFFVECK